MEVGRTNFGQLRNIVRVRPDLTYLSNAFMPLRHNPVNREPMTMSACENNRIHKKDRKKKARSKSVEHIYTVFFFNIYTKLKNQNKQ